MNDYCRKLSKILPWNVSMIIARNQSNYEILGLKRGASKKEIRKAYLEQSKKHHPDVNKGNLSAHHKFIQIQNAYHSLQNEPCDAPDESIMNVNRETKKSSTTFRGNRPRTWQTKSSNFNYRSAYYGNRFFYDEEILRNFRSSCYKSPYERYRYERPSFYGIYSSRPPAFHPDALLHHRPWFLFGCCLLVLILIDIRNYYVAKHAKKIRHERFARYMEAQHRRKVRDS
ncbi:hypothetical protein GJ496_011000 [Pomphorhynchus laevis]|nr:hypothetical protein GJ496_011000 [Pomphorhynchus laevis]